MKIPMSSPDLTSAEVEAVRGVLRTPHLSIGPRIVKFEEAFAAYIGAASAVAVSSGTAGLHLCVIAAGVEDGDLVLTSPLSFIASANVLLYERAVPIFVDVDPKTMTPDSTLVAEAVDDLSHGGKRADRWLPPELRDLGHAWDGPRLKAILVVHAFGQPADMDPLLGIARDRGLRVIEDACEAIGAQYKGRNVGNLGDAGVFAFYPNKQMTTGEGGMIVTDNADWAALCRSVRNQGRSDGSEWLRHDRLGYNYRLDEMSAALGLAQLDRIEDLLAKRDRVAGWYYERLQGFEGIEVLHTAPWTTRMSWFVYVIRLDPVIDRDAVRLSMEEKSVPTRVYFPPIHLQPYYAKRFGFHRGDFPATEKIGEAALALPFSGVMTEDEVDYVCKSLMEAIHESPALGRAGG